jgi:hypothetical protein
MNANTEPKVKRPFPILHLYSPPCFHDEAFVAGNRQGLELLKAEIEKALEGAKPGADTLYFNADGEGGYLVVEVFEQKEAENLALPYSGEFASESNWEADNVVFPWKRWEERLKP